MQRTIYAAIRPNVEGGFYAECPQLHAVTQGRDLDEVAANLQEVVALALEGEDLDELGIAPDPVILVNIELQPVLASA